ALRVIVLSLILVTLGAMLAAGDFLNTDSNAAGLNIDQIDGATVKLAVTFTIVFSTWAGVGMVLAFILPLAVADTIPLDEQTGTRDLLDTTPLPLWVYLLGKTLGVWAAVGSGMLLVFGITTMAWGMRVGFDAFDYGPYLTLWGVGVVALIVLNGGFGVLVTATQPNRRRAVMVMLAVFLPLIFLTMPASRGEWLAYASPLRMPMLMYFFSGPTTLYEAPTQYIFSDVALTIAVGVAQLLLLGGGMWAWLRLRQKS
ncbi:MAG: hypothetical protein SF029_19610, partial [bacterium]|nr:hypothetical protein [bacterium]